MLKSEAISISSCHRSKLHQQGERENEGERDEREGQCRESKLVSYHITNAPCWMGPLIHQTRLERPCSVGGIWATSTSGQKWWSTSLNVFAYRVRVSVKYYSLPSTLASVVWSVILGFAFVTTTTNVICNCYTHDPRVGALWLQPNIHASDHKLGGRVEHEASNSSMNTEENMLSYTLTIPSSQPILETVHQWQFSTKM